jgi:uncharacterized protein (DUF983 family)
MSEPFNTAILRGLRGQCPNCGKGHMFRAFLKVADHCDRCGEELHHHRADDLPAYLVVALVGHLVVAMALFVEADYALALWIEMAIFVPLTLVLSLMLLQPTKGAVVALQWSVGMHGFAQSRQMHAKPSLRRDELRGCRGQQRRTDRRLV